MTFHLENKKIAQQHAIIYGVGVTDYYEKKTENSMAKFPHFFSIFFHTNRMTKKETKINDRSISILSTYHLPNYLPTYLPLTKTKNFQVKVLF